MFPSILAGDREGKMEILDSVGPAGDGIGRPQFADGTAFSEFYAPYQNEPDEERKAQ